MNGARLIRVTLGLLSAMAVATLCRFALLDMRTASATLSDTLSFVWIYGLPLALVGAAAGEGLRLRSVTPYVFFGTTIALVAAYFATRTEILTSAAFSGGALGAVSVLLCGLLPALAYWAIAGRRAGWQGDEAERAGVLAVEAFRTASASADPRYCRTCLLALVGAGALVFALAGWLAIDASGLGRWLVSETEYRGNAALRKTGYTWASFKVLGSRGVVEGSAPDEVQKRAAFDSVREALEAVTGFPGVLTAIENATVARVPMAAVSQQLEDAARREAEARAAVMAARTEAEQARAGEAEARRKAEEQLRATEAELKRRLEEQARIAEAAARDAAQSKAAEAAARDAEQKKTAELAVREAEQKKVLEAAAREAEVRKAAEAQAAAAAEGEHKEAKADIEAAPEPGADAGSAEAAEDETLQNAPAGCTEQDRAIIEGSRIFFEPQRFDVATDYEQELERLAVSARACAPRAVMISGHADTDDDSLFNSALSLQRAQAVRELLVTRGVPATVVLTRAAGTSAQIERDARAPSRTLNRRAEFKLVAPAEISRDATLGPDERATTCENDLEGIMAKSIIHFASASAKIGEDSLALVNKLAKAVRTCGSVIITIEGHTDSTGPAEFNQDLSELRAKSVREALVFAGADPTRLATKGFASSRPYDPSGTREALALNRRIEFRVSGKFTSTSTAGP